MVCFRTARMVSDSHFGLCQIVRLLLLRDADGVCSERQRRRRVTTLIFICAPVQNTRSNSAFASSQSVNPRPFLCADRSCAHFRARYSYREKYALSNSGQYPESMVKDESAGESLSVSKLYHIRHPTRRSLGPPVWGPLPCRRAQYAIQYAIHSIGVVALRSIGAKGRFC